MHGELENPENPGSGKPVPDWGWGWGETQVSQLQAGSVSIGSRVMDSQLRVVAN